MSSVLWPLLATAAARLIVVVVLPTPPFWLATVMIIETAGILLGKRFQSHLVLAQIFRREVLEPCFGFLFRVLPFRRDGLGLVEDGLGDVDRSFGAEGQGDGVAGAGVDLHDLVAADAVDEQTDL